jgi:hypothetical protein
MAVIEKKLIAPCGMNCGVCSLYLSYKNQIKTVKIRYCEGCRPRNKVCFVKRKCKGELRLLSDKIDFCYQCDLFPCDNLVKLDARYRNNYGMSMIDNLKEIEKNGINRFIQSQCNKYRCFKCGKLISTHNRKCFVCDKIYSWKS